LRVAEWCAKQAQFGAVHHPGLASHPDHQDAQRLMGGFGGMLAVELKGGARAAERFLRALTIAAHAPSLGGVETLVSEPRLTSHAMLTPDAQPRAGIPDGFLRFSIGLDDSDDIIADFAQALAQLQVIKFTNVFKAFPKGGLALKDVSFHIAKGEFVFLTGHSGAGKSTVLKLVYADEPVTSGEVRVSGFNAADLRPRDVPMLRRRLGIVFQDFRLLEDRTAEENVAFALEVTGARRSSIPARVMRVLTQVGLAAKAQAYPRELSGGEQQRVAIARALVNEPSVLLADEPTGNLDERATRGVFQLLRDINASGTAVVMATHDLDLVRQAPYRVIELQEGALERAGDELVESRDVLQELGRNPLPASIEVKLKPRFRDAEHVNDVADRLRGFGFVDDVRFGRDWVEKLDRLRQIAAAVGLVVGAAFAVVAIIIIGTTIRMAVLQRGREIAIMRLVGATNGFIRRPFLLQGAIKGMLGGLVAVGLSYGAYTL